MTADSPSFPPAHGSLYLFMVSVVFQLSAYPDLLRCEDFKGGILSLENAHPRLTTSHDLIAYFTSVLASILFPECVLSDYPLTKECLGCFQVGTAMDNIVKNFCDLFCVTASISSLHFFVGLYSVHTIIDFIKTFLHKYVMYLENICPCHYLTPSRHPYSFP